MVKHFIVMLKIMAGHAKVVKKCRGSEKKRRFAGVLGPDEVLTKGLIKDYVAVPLGEPFWF